MGDASKVKALKNRTKLIAPIYFDGNADTEIFKKNIFYLN
jgi:hypothetical protein